MAEETPCDEPFRFPVEDVFTLTGRGTAVAGHVESGTVRVGDRLRVIRADGRPGPSGTCSWVDVPCTIGRRAPASTSIGLIFRDLQKSDFEPGDVIVGEIEV
ncbi:hypothetical protein OHB26_05795 [Nocardia sp. NBC_01503]|uniref:hypothetical protein n=1 Tax=Nocardia sp. NBC_01503 TaxID=2975997 RepID=UPI002E7C1FB6|nr:hypothetical protein [Nocardia sp. NBC_01503]WTL33736.1 hypothetical protein OHB26_05795 [Nocardia sp. NBC_01503]